MPTFVLNLGQKCQLAAQRRGAGDPVALGQHADNFRMGMLANLPDQRLAIGSRHRIVGFDFLFAIDARLKCRQKLFGFLGCCVSADQSL